MKKSIILLAITLPLFASAQSDTTYWKKGGSFGINFNQATLSNWAAGGANSFSWASYFGFFADYEKDQIVWKNTLDTGIGWINEKNSEPTKSEDKLNFNSTVGRKLNNSGKWYLTLGLDFRTQYAKGFSEDDITRASYISKFMAPGYLNVGLGIDWKASSKFNVNMALISNKTTIVNDEFLSNQGAFGVDTGSVVRAEFGATITATYQNEIFTNVNWKSNLILFANYLENPEKIDVNWENSLNMKINKVLTANLYNQLIYDYDIKFEVLDDNGNVIGSDERLQFKNILSLGLTLKFGGTR